MNLLFFICIVGLHLFIMQTQVTPEFRLGPAPQIHSCQLITPTSQLSSLLVFAKRLPTCQVSAGSCLCIYLKGI